MTEIERCPFLNSLGLTSCNAAASVRYRFPEGRVGDPLFFVECHVCNACGPESTYRPDAIDRWNELVRRARATNLVAILEAYTQGASLGAEAILAVHDIADVIGFRMPHPLDKS